MEKQFPNIEQYTDEQLELLIAAAQEILNAHKQSKTPLSTSHGWHTSIAA